MKLSSSLLRVSVLKLLYGARLLGHPVYCNLAYELLCLSHLYRSKMELFAFLTVIWQYLQQLTLHSQCSAASGVASPKFGEGQKILGEAKCLILVE